MKNHILIKVLLVPFVMMMAASAQADLNLANGYATGQWYNPARDGEGFFVEVIGEGDNLQISVAMYSYDEQGNQLWLAGNVAIEDGDVGATVPAFLIEGPVWGTAYDPADRSTTEFGTIVVRFPACDTGLFNVNSNVAGLESGSYSVVRLTEIVGMDCVEPPPPDTQPPPPPGTGITTGLWTAEGVCFFVNLEGTKIIETDECDQGKAFSADIPGVEVDIDGKLKPDVCDSNVACGAAWDIYETTSAQGVTISQAHCVNELGGIGLIKFSSGTRASVWAFEAQDIDGRICASAEVDATSAQ
jgi:hypothetical protein